MKQMSKAKINALKQMYPGDIISFGSNNSETPQYSLMLGLLEDKKTLGFWDLDTQDYVPYNKGVDLFSKAERWTLFVRTDHKWFDRYKIATYEGDPYNLSVKYYWTGGIDDKPSYVQIYTKVDISGVVQHGLMITASLIGIKGNAEVTSTSQPLPSNTTCHVSGHRELFYLRKISGHRELFFYLG